MKYTKILFLLLVVYFCGCDPNSQNECTIQCQNGATCENGTCKCPPGYSGADCGTVDTPPADTIYFSVNGVSFSKGSIASITPTSAYVLSDFRSITGVQVVDYGHCWSKINTLPTVSDNHKAYGPMASPQSFTTLMDNLEPNTVYYVRTYCIVNGTTYYHERAVAFTTLPPQAPVLTTGSVSNITTNSAFITGSIDNLGTYPITSYGHCWSEFANPTINNAKTINTSNNTAITFNSTITGLIEYKTYYIRAYATNSNGESFYGNEQTFTTESSIAVRGGLICYYTYDSGTANDIIGSYNGILFGPSPSGDTPNGLGYSMDFVSVENDYISIPNSPILSTSSGTFNFWIKTVASSGTIFSTSGASYPASLYLASNKIIWTRNSGISSNTFSTDISTLALNNQWHMISVFLSSSVMRLYIDGVLIDVITSTNQSSMYDEAPTARMGAYMPTSTVQTPINAKIDNFRIHNRELTQSEIIQIYNARQ